MGWKAIWQNLLERCFVRFAKVPDSEGTV